MRGVDPGAKVKKLARKGAIPKKDWKLVHVDSESKFNGKLGSRAFDGDPATIWHTEWQDAQPPHPHQIVIDLRRARAIKRMIYAPRADGGANGMIKDLEVYVGDLPGKFGEPACKGRFQPGAGDKEVTLPNLAKGRLFRLVAQIDLFEK